MLIKKINRRSFFRYASNGIIAGALGRVFQETQAFGEEGRLKLLICTTPNGHFDFQSTKAALSSSLSADTLSRYALFLNNMDNASTVNEGGQGIGDWHGGESALLSFNTFKSSGPSFYTTIPGLKKAYLGVDVFDRVYARDSSGGQVAVLNDPAAAMGSIFGGSALKLNSYDMALIQSGQKSILDPCLDDINKLKAELGSDGALFDDYVFALKAMMSENTPSSGDDASSANIPDYGPAFEAPTCDKTASVSPGSTVEERHQGMLDVAYQIMACDVAQVVVLSFLNNNSDPQHQYIHGNGSNDGGAAFKGFCDETQSRIGALAERLATGGYNLLDRSALVYISEGGAHFLNGSFNNQHPQKNIPGAIFGSLGGVINKTGDLDLGGLTNRNLWRSLADGMALGQASLSEIGGADVTPLSLA